MTDNQSKLTDHCSESERTHSDMLLEHIRLADKQLDALQQDYVLLFNHYNNMKQEYAEWRKQLMLWSAASIVSVVVLAIYLAYLLAMKG